MGWKPETFADLGTILAARIAELSEGRMSLDVPVLLNRAVVEHDVALVVGPVLGHHPGAGVDRRRRRPDPEGEAGAMRGDRRGRRRRGRWSRRRRCRLSVPGSGLHSVSFGDTRASWASAAEVCGHPRHLSRRAGPPGAVARSRDVRRDLDRGQWLLQARAGRRRRRGRSATSISEDVCRAANLGYWTRRRSTPTPSRPSRTRWSSRGPVRCYSGYVDPRGRPGAPLSRIR